MQDDIVHTDAAAAGPVHDGIDGRIGRGENVEGERRGARYNMLNCSFNARDGKHGEDLRTKVAVREGIEGDESTGVCVCV